MTVARELTMTTVDRIVERFGLTEQTGPDGGPLIPLPGPMPGAGGVCRTWTGDKVQRMVYVGLAFPPAGLDSHMIFAFTPPQSPVPHFTLDAVVTAEMHAFHLDLIPRVDLGANLDYIDEVFGPLTEAFDSGRAIEGLSVAHISPRQVALMSPWMLAYRATESAFQQLPGVVDAYLDHWTKLVENGVAATSAGSAERDRANRAAIFNPDVDPVWNQIEPLVGAENNQRIRALLKGEA